MRSIRLLSSSLLFFALLLSILPDPARADRVDDYVREQLQYQRIPGASIAVVRDGRVVKAKGYGLANVEQGTPATVDTVYQIQSLTKSFTAAGVLMLVNEGKIGLDDPVAKYLDGAPEAWKEITIRRLLTHTSGIKDYINEPTASLRLDVTDEEVLAATAPRPLNFAPGERYAYSNTNYLLLGMVIRKVTGKSYGSLLRERVFEPLGMGTTRVNSLADVIPKRAAGYIWNGSGWSNGEYIAPSILSYPGGGLLSTAPDLAKWSIALDTDRLLPEATRRQMWTPARLNDGSESGYGFGWAIGAVNGHRCINHSGAHATGFSTFVARYPDDGLAVIVLTNLAGANVNRIAQGIAGRYVPALMPQQE